MNLWESLLEILEEQTKTYRQLNELMEVKGKLIIEEQLGQLEELVAEEGALAKHITLLEKKRIEIVSRLCEELSLDQTNLTLSQLGEYLPKDYQDRYLQLKEKLSQALKRASVLNKQNQELLACSLSYINFSLSLLAGLNDSSPIYGQPGKEKTEGKTTRSIFDQKV